MEAPLVWTAAKQFLASTQHSTVDTRTRHTTQQRHTKQHIMGRKSPRRGQWILLGPLTDRPTLPSIYGSKAHTRKGLARVCPASRLAHAASAHITSPPLPFRLLSPSRTRFPACLSPPTRGRGARQSRVSPPRPPIRHRRPCRSKVRSSRRSLSSLPLALVWDRVLFRADWLVVFSFSRVLTGRLGCGVVGFALQEGRPSR